jgi:tetratricopeptide (TPR) repeat protein
MFRKGKVQQVIDDIEVQQVEVQQVIDDIEDARAGGNQARALDLALEGLSAFPEHPELIGLGCQLLCTWERFDEAMELVERSTALSPDRANALAAETHEKAHRLDEALALRREIRVSDPSDRGNYHRYISLLLKSRRFDSAEVEIEKFASEYPESAWTLRLDWLQKKRLRREALEFMEALLATKPDHIQYRIAFGGQLLNCVKKDHDPTVRDRAAEFLDELTPEALTNRGMVTVALNLAVALGRDAQTRELLTRAPEGDRNQLFRRVAAAVSHRDGDIAKAKQIWDAHCAEKSYPTLRPCRPGELSRVDDRPLNQDRAEIRLFTVIRNELWRLPWFINYYRALGVDRFFFVDNDSTDGSLQWLLTQPDVHVFHTVTPYAIGRSGMVWVNDLVSSFGRDGWVLYVDVDEALVFPGIERHDLRGLTNYMQRKGHELAAGQMVDMFALDDPPLSPDGFETDFISNYPYFDPCYKRTPEHGCPYYHTAGGIRRLVGTGENQTKTPLIRGGRNIRFLASSHRVTPGVISDVSVALLHFKLAGDFRKQLREDAASNNRITACQARYQESADFFESWTSTDLDSSIPIVRYESSQSLVDTGLLTPPIDYGR